MATLKTVTGKIVGPGGAALNGARVTAILSQATTIPGTQETPPLQVYTTTATDGTWTLSLYSNNDLMPNGTFYTVYEDGNTPLVIQVPQTAGPFAVSNIITSTPTASPTPNHVSTLQVDGSTSNGLSISATGDLAARSVTVSSGSGPYASVLADGVTPTPSGWAMADRAVTAKDPYHAKAWGIKSDGQFLGDGAMNGTTAVLTSASNPFVAADVGKLILVPGAGAAGTLLTTTIASYQSSGQVTLAAVSQTAVANALVTWGTDDSASWTALHATAPQGATIIIPTGYSLYRGSFMGGITKNLALQGGGVEGLRVTFDPQTRPYLVGSVIVQCQAAANGIDITGTALSVPRRDFGIMFADGIKFVNTGHGIYSVPSALDGGGGHMSGEMYCKSSNVMVFGHDGNHYGYYAVNPCGIINELFVSTGGGVVYIECDSTVGNYGNAVFISPYGALFCGGTADGYRLKGAGTGATGALNLIDWDRPQVNITAVPGAFSSLGIAAPTIAQYLWNVAGVAGAVKFIGITDPDLEGWAFNNPVEFGGTSATPRWRVDTGGGVLSTAPATGYPTLNVDTPINAPTTFQLLVGGNNALVIQRGSSLTAISLTPGSFSVDHETIGMRLVGPTLTLTSGLGSQRHLLVSAPTYNGAFTITDAATMQIAGAPLGTVTYTRKYQLWLAGTDKVRFDTTTQSTIGANGAASALTANPVGYLPVYIGTAVQIIPYYNP